MNGIELIHGIFFHGNKECFSFTSVTFLFVSKKLPLFLGIKPLNFKFLVILEAPALFDATRSSLLYLVNHRLSADIIKE